MQTAASPLRQSENQTISLTLIATECWSEFLLWMAQHSESYYLPTLLLPSPLLMLPSGQPPGQRSNVLHFDKRAVLDHVANEIYDTKRDCRFCAQNHTHSKQERQLKLCFSENSLEYIGMEILERLSMTTQRSQFVVVMADHYSKLTKAIPTAKINATTVTRIFLKHWVASYGIPFNLLNYNSHQLLSMFFEAVCSSL